MFRILVLLGSSLLFSASPAWAQTSEPASSSVNIKDEVVSMGTIRGRDKAMGAFFSGDYETAEIEFEKNFDRIRFQRMRIQDARTRMVGAEFTAEAAKNMLGSGRNGPSKTALAINNDSTRADMSNGKDKGNLKGVSSGTDLSFQLYMSGLSELKQGKMDEAKISLRRSVRMNGRNYDARYRLALLNILDKDYTSARTQLNKIEKRAKACQTLHEKMCKERNEVEEAANVLNTALSERS